MKYTLFIGCTIPARENNYELSAREVLSKLGIELGELPEQSCCGLPFRALDYKAWITLAARNLALASVNDAPVMVLCNGCYKSLKTADKELQENPKLMAEVNRRLSIEKLELSRHVDVKHVAEVLHDDYRTDRLKEKVSKHIDINVAVHPGCHITMPSKIMNFDDPEFARKLDRLVEITGAKPVRYRTKKLCCGATIVGIDEDVSRSLVKQKISDITGKVDALITFCPLCHVTYDIQQLEAVDEEKRVPVLHYTQLLGLAMGIPSRRLGFDLNRVDVEQLLAKLENTK